MSVLVIMAHPDDLEFSCGGTVAAWVSQGRPVDLVLVTRGESGNENEPGWNAERVARARADEQAKAGQVLGLRSTIWLDHPDGEVVPSLELRLQLVRCIRASRPELVVTLDPTRFYYEGGLNHPDHRAVGTAAFDALYPNAGNRMYHPELLEEGLEPHSPREVWLAMAARPNHWVDISETLERKLEALYCHSSQVAHMHDLDRRVREWCRHHDPDGRVLFREGFRCVPL